MKDFHPVMVWPSLLVIGGALVLGWDRMMLVGGVAVAVIVVAWFILTIKGEFH